MSGEKRYVFFILVTFTAALVVEAVNFWIVKWWMFQSIGAFGKTLLLWIILGMLLGTLSYFEKAKLVGPTFATWGVIIETINLYHFGFWEFTSKWGMIGTYVVWVLTGITIRAGQELFSIDLSKW